MKNSDQEVEIKLQLTKKIYEEFIHQYAKKSITLFQENYFFDSLDKILLSKKWALRIRIENKNRGYITVKGPGEIIDTIHVRPEYEESLALEKAQELLKGFHLSAYRLHPLIELVKRFGDHYVESFLLFTNLRITSQWKKWRLEIDMTTIGKTIFYELEAETDFIHKEELTKDLIGLLNSHGWEFKPSEMSKFKRALSILKPYA